MKRSVYIFLAGLFCLDLMLWLLVSTQQAAAQPALYFLNVGQGDSELVILPSGAKVLIDGGPTAAVLDNLAKILPPTDRYIDLLMMSHPQLDHFAGFIDVLKNYQVGAFIGNGRKGNIGAYTELDKQLTAQGAPYIELSEGDAIVVGNSRFDILSPTADELLSGELNDTCLVARLQTPQYSALYTGDIGANIEERLVRDYDLKSDILKVGHHGSRFSSSEAFVKEVDPKISVIEVGAHNTYGHPTKQALTNLASVADQVLRTDTQGLLKIIFEDEQLKILQQK
jgi:competence protein ComEC